MTPEYYRGHALEKVSLDLLQKIPSQEFVLSLISSSKNHENRFEFLNLVLQKYDKLEQGPWMDLSKMPLEIAKKVLGFRYIRDEILVVAKFNIHLALKIDEYDFEKLARAIVENDQVVVSYYQVKYGLIGEKFLGESNGIYETFGITKKEFSFKGITLKPMEYYFDFFTTGINLRSCTGFKSHWENVREGLDLRFMVIRDGVIVGTILFQEKNVWKAEVVERRMFVYGFEKNYRQYSKNTIFEMIKVISPFITKFKITGSEYIQHGITKETPIDL